jgi:7-cyano-7-deazaguanine synthase in queuosine biosynthesis
MGLKAVLEEVLLSRGIKDEGDLNYMEKEVVEAMVTQVQDRELTPEDLRFNISQMRRAIEDQLTDDDVAVPLTKKAEQKRLFLTARLKNMIMIERILLSPTEAKKYIQGMLNQLKNPNQL